MRGFSTTEVLVGSKGEGIGIGVESDIDVLAVANFIFCTENLDNIQDPSKYTQIYLIDRTNVPPGYCCLRNNYQFVNINIHDVIQGEITGPSCLPENSMSDFKGVLKNMLPVLQIISIFNQITIVIIKRFLKDMLEHLSYDFVYALSFVFPGLLTDWCERKRQYDWPSR